MSANPRLSRFPTLALAASACLVIAVFAVAASPASATTNCSNFPDDGSQYPSSSAQWTELRTTSVTCGYARKFLKPFWTCRTAGGKSLKGQCKRKVQGFSCTEGKRKYTTIDGKQASYGVRVTCRRGGQRIIAAYTQDLG
jgi:hypothetical protein